MNSVASSRQLPQEPIILPLLIEQRAERAGAAIRLALLCVLALIMLSPFVMLAAHAAVEPSARELMQERPQSLFLLGLALVTLCVLLGWPARIQLRRLVESRLIAIDQDWVGVREKTLFGEKTWRQPLSAYSGIRHRIRATVSGSRHEIVLTHSDPRFAIVLATPDPLCSAEIEHFCEALGLPEIAADIKAPSDTNRGNTRPANKVQTQRAA